MSSGKNQRNAERKAREAELDASSRAREAEQARKASLSMWARIDEADVSEDVKEILHMMAEKLGLE